MRYFPVPPIITAKVLFHINREDVNHQNPPEYDYGPLPDTLERVFREQQADWENMRENWVREKLTKNRRGEALRIGGFKDLKLGE